PVDLPTGLPLLREEDIPARAQLEALSHGETEERAGTPCVILEVPAGAQADLDRTLQQSRLSSPSLGRGRNGQEADRDREHNPGKPPHDVGTGLPSASRR